MPDRVPPEVLILLHAADPASREPAWQRFVDNHSRLLLHVARSVILDPDRAMDAYAWLLERLHEDGARRLRGFSPEGDSKFTTWLVVVARRICIDFLRAQGGRSHDGMNEAHPLRRGHMLRRRLLQLAGEPIDLATLEGSGPAPDRLLLDAERHELLQAALRALPANDRLMLSLRFDDGLEAEAIAGTLRLPTRFHVYRRLDRVLRRLRAALQQRGMEDPT